jgi:hypothetical protein
LQHRTSQVQITNGFYSRLDESWGSGQGRSVVVQERAIDIEKLRILLQQFKYRYLKTPVRQALLDMTRKARANCKNALALDQLEWRVEVRFC